MLVHIEMEYERVDELYLPRTSCLRRSYMHGLLPASIHHDEVRKIRPEMHQGMKHLEA